MPFQNMFEKKVNNEMHEDGVPGRAPPEAQDAEMDKKRRPISHAEFEEGDHHNKKDQPPRFSTLFTNPPVSQAAPPPRPREYVQEYYPPPERRRGVFMPMPLFVVFAAILFFESTILFAYTVIGLYNNAPARLFPWAGQGGHTETVACNCDEKQAAVNFAPNFLMPAGAQAATDVITVTLQPTSTSTSTSSTSASTSSSSSATTTTASTSSLTEAAAAASGIAGILGGIATTSEDAGSLTATTQSATQGIVTSVKLITTTPSPAPASTVFATTWVNGPVTTATADSSDAGKA